MKPTDCELSVSIYQMDIEWENKQLNLNKLESKLNLLKGKTDLLVLPEMFSTGFSMHPEYLAETTTQHTIKTLIEFSKQYNIAICGSFIAKDNDKYFNRAFFVADDLISFYDKRHLFHIGSESKKYSSGDIQPIISYKGFNICLQICYDLRFPVWIRNKHKQYDLLIYVANWPQTRTDAWNILLRARAIENIAYVCGVNRIGVDNNGLIYNGQSAFVDFKGDYLFLLEPDCKNESIITQKICKKELDSFRNKFPVWKDADEFYLQ